jgi:hypothetical protein
MVTVEDYLEIPEGERKKRHLILRQIEDSCSCGCNKIIEEHPDERYRINGEPVTSDCYFKYMSKHLDNSPINSPEFAC